MFLRMSYKTWLLLFLAALGLWAFIYTSPRMYSLCPAQLRYDRNEMLAEASKQAVALGYSVQNYNVRISLTHNKRLLSYIQDHYRDEERQKALLSLPAYYWQVLWYKPQSSIRLVRDYEPERPSSIYRINGLAMDFSLDGRAIAFRLTEDDGDSVCNVAESVAAAVADSMLNLIWHGRPANAAVTRVTHTATDRSTSYGFLYALPEKESDLNMRFRVEMTGRQLKKWEYVYEPGEAAEPPSSGMEPLRLISFLLLLILYAIFFVKRLRDDLIDFRHAVPIVVLTALTTLLVMLNSTWGMAYKELWGPLLSALLVTPLVFWIAYASADSLAREVWEDKLLSVDALCKGRFFNRLFGSRVLAGFCFGLITLGAIGVLLFVVGLGTRMDMIPWSIEFNILSAWSPFYYSICEIANQVLWLQFSVLLFLVALLARYFSKPIWIIGANALVWSIGMLLFINLPSSPIWVNMLVAGLIGAIQAYAFIKWDFLTSIVAHAVWVTGLMLMHQFMLAHPTFYLSMGGVLIGWAVLLVAAFAALRHPVDEEDLRQFTPRHAVKIIERMRLRRELEIAAEVQLSFLPKQVPRMAGLDIASLCLPALEVGGDYYDFITLDQHRLAIAVGDVSGKGVSAAFYMTLTKGFLRSLTRSIASPRQVMVEMNRLYWENVDRSHFISMIYGVFDIRAQTFTFVRAGHNPVLTVQNQKLQGIIPKGLALGLENGVIFDQVLEEKVISIKPGDLVAFYTDGFSEARNLRLEEYGEERLAQTLWLHRDAPAADIVAAMKAQVQAHTGRALQHDDMTMIIVRVTEA